MLPDIHDYSGIRMFANNEAKSFNLHKVTNFGGGRFQTKHPCIFIHIRYNGELSRIEIVKPGGTKFYINP